MLIKVAVLADTKELEEIYSSSFESNAAFFPDDMEEEDDDGEEDFSFESAITMSKKTVLGFWENARLIGGAVISQDVCEINLLERLFILPEKKGKGYGYRAWMEIEKMYPCVREWRLRTPTCLINNVCFYVNKCGFSIVRVEDMGNDGVGMYVFSKPVR
ncbi:GNAT family N-acetyltransferase [Pectobacterium versatile]|uniref:GNAT family N-acetyltransferase n=1 Tax=Pectobacterium versatile TaxID=2488639 RepID=UPI000D607255|nr:MULTISPECIES: GNAT family N-acetyltransferase [Pectobacterium]MBQ4793607.1 N-acetyltransferase [Pectobacterium versatile]MCA6916821.1 GNAT family N-acetyltransferase [Pectobacterium versatile]MCL6397983.1 N-acetyltransferase [Pectobacterium carotovorum subsp. carotovorum]PWD72731.1 GNAT family N-acetyltransferase [Pectobacterium versatile]TAI82942.1 N-acetyltransferase [Pectobacterium versatile]